MWFHSEIEGESYNQYICYTVKVCYRQAKETNIGNGGQPHLVEHNDVCDVAGQSKDTDRNGDAKNVQVYGV